MVTLGFLAVPVVLALLPGEAGSTDHFMVELPAFVKYGCLNCHTTDAPTPVSHDLNRFGSDFLANGKVWNRALADMNSDGDKCSNGFELGDVDGDGVFDQGEQIRENSNPGNPEDCSIALTEGTWGIIKEIFKRNEWPEGSPKIP